MKKMMKDKNFKMAKIIKKFICIFGVFLLCLSVLFSCGYKSNLSPKVETTANIELKEITETIELEYTFRTNYLKKEHFDKHGKSLGYKNSDEYELGANRVIKSKDALIKEEKEDGDYVYYIVDTNEIVFLSKDGYIRSYFKPEKGKRYFDKQ